MGRYNKLKSFNGVPFNRVEEEESRTNKLRAREKKIEGFIREWNSSKVVDTITEKEAIHLLLQFHLQRPLSE